MLSAGVSEQLAQTLQVEVAGLRKENRELTQSVVQLQEGEHAASHALAQLQHESARSVQSYEAALRASSARIQLLEAELHTTAPRRDAAPSPPPSGGAEKQQELERQLCALLAPPEHTSPPPPPPPPPPRRGPPTSGPTSKPKPKRGPADSPPPPPSALTAASAELPAWADSTRVMELAREARGRWMERLEKLHVDAAHARREALEQQALRAEESSSAQRQLKALECELEMMRLELRAAEATAHLSASRSGAVSADDEGGPFKKYVERRRLANSMGYHIAIEKETNSKLTSLNEAGSHARASTKLPQLPPLRQAADETSFAAMEAAMRARWSNYISGQPQSLLDSRGELGLLTRDTLPVTAPFAGFARAAGVGSSSRSSTSKKKRHLPADKVDKQLAAT